MRPMIVGLALIALSGICSDLEPGSLFVEGYTGQVSYKAGDEVTLHVSTSAKVWALEVARLGAKREVVMTKTALPGAGHVVPENASSHGCGWPEAFKFTLPADWKSGYYQVILRVSDAGGPYVQRNRRTAEGECFFIVRPAKPRRAHENPPATFEQHLQRL